MPEVGVEGKSLAAMAAVIYGAAATGRARPGA